VCKRVKTCTSYAFPADGSDARESIDTAVFGKRPTIPERKLRRLLSQHAEGLPAQLAGYAEYNLMSLTVVSTFEHQLISATTKALNLYTHHLLNCRGDQEVSLLTVVSSLIYDICPILRCLSHDGFSFAERLSGAPVAANTPLFKYIRSLFQDSSFPGTLRSGDMAQALKAICDISEYNKTRLSTQDHVYVPDAIGLQLNKFKSFHFVILDGSRR